MKTTFSDQGFSMDKHPAAQHCLHIDTYVRSRAFRGIYSSDLNSESATLILITPFHATPFSRRYTGPHQRDCSTFLECIQRLLGGLAATLPREMDYGVLERLHYLHKTVFLPF
jgi:hypothetical protein